MCMVAAVPCDNMQFKHCNTPRARKVQQLNATTDTCWSVRTHVRDIQYLEQIDTVYLLLAVEVGAVITVKAICS